MRARRTRAGGMREDVEMGQAGWGYPPPDLPPHSPNMAAPRGSITPSPAPSPWQRDSQPIAERGEGPAPFPPMAPPRTERCPFLPPPPLRVSMRLTVPSRRWRTDRSFPTSLRDARGPSTPLLRSLCARLYDPRDGTAPPLPPRYSAVPPLHGAALSPLPPLYPPPSSTSL